MLPALWVSIFLLFGSIFCQRPDIEAEVDSLVRAGMSARGIPSVSLAVVNKGTVTLSKGYGFKDVETKTPADADTLYGIASNTKAITAFVLAKLLRKHPSYTVTTNVYKILGQNQTKFNNTLRSTYATLEDLMTHSLGIPRNSFMRLDTTLTRSNLMARLQYLPSTSAFRRSFVYSDLLYGLLAHITEVLTGSGKSWEDIVTSEFFQPLSMTNSTFTTRVNFSSPDVATPYSVSAGKVVTKMDREFLRVYSQLGGSGAIMSTANDMAKYLLFLVNGGKNQSGEQVVEASDFESAFSPRASLPASSRLYPISRPTTPVTMSTDAYGLGWRVGYYRGYRMLQHTGSTFGYNSMITILPHSSRAIYTAINGNDNGYGFRSSLHCAVLDLLLGEKPWINSTTIATFPAPWVSATRARRSVHRFDESRNGNEVGEIAQGESDDWIFAQSSMRRLSLKRRNKREAGNVFGYPLANYSGVFVHGAYGTANVVIDVLTGNLTMTYGIGKWVLTPSGIGYEFDADWLGPAPAYDIRLRFLVNKDVFGFECLDCDPKYVPSFYRHK